MNTALRNPLLPLLADGPRIYNANAERIAVVTGFSRPEDVALHVEYIVTACNEYASLRSQIETMSQAQEALIAVARSRADAVEALAAKLEKIAKWLERLAWDAECQARDTRFITLSEASAADAKNYRATVADIRAALALVAKDRQSQTNQNPLALATDSAKNEAIRATNAELVKKLRFLYESHPLIQEAADAIEALR